MLLRTFDPTNRFVAHELESQWNAALERVAQLEQRLVRMDSETASRPAIDRGGLMALAHDLPAAWNAPGTTMRTKQRLTRILIQEVVIDLDDQAHEAIVTIHWTGGSHTEVRVARLVPDGIRMTDFPAPSRSSANLAANGPIATWRSR